MPDLPVTPIQINGEPIESLPSPFEPEEEPSLTASLPLPLSHFIHLETLSLAANDLPLFPELFGLSNLKKLDVSFNKIVEIPADIAVLLANLQELNLQSYPFVLIYQCNSLIAIRNLIEKLPPMMKTLKKLNVEQNPLHPAFYILMQNGDLLPQLQAPPGISPSCGLYVVFI